MSGISIDIATTTVEAALDIGWREIREDIGKVFGKTLLGTVGPEKVHTDKGFAQMTPFPTFIAALISVFLLSWQQCTTYIEPAMMEYFIKTIDNGLIGCQVLVEELGQGWFLRRGGLALAIDAHGIFGLGLQWFVRCSLFSNGLLLTVFAQVSYAVKQLEEVVEVALADIVSHTPQEAPHAGRIFEHSLVTTKEVEHLASELKVLDKID